MIAAINILQVPQAISRKLTAGIVAYAIIAVIGLREYVELTSINFLLGLLALSMVFSLKPARISYRFAWVAIVFSLLAILLPVKTFLYFATGAAFLLVIESTSGKQGALALLIMAFMSPVFKYFVNIFSFPIRLQLTSWAGKILSFTGNAAEVKGNVIYNGNGGFSVDPECMGLNMMVTSLVLGIMLIALYQKKYSKRLALWQTGIFLSAICVLNIISNLFRIVCLVHFEIMPETFMHNVLGICCLLVYVIVPAVCIARFMVQRLGSATAETEQVSPRKTSYKQILLHVIVAVSVCAATARIVQHRTYKDHHVQAAPALNNYKVSRVDAGVLKLENERSLVYIKPISGFYSTDHNPMICWSGSGYVFEQVREREVNGLKLYSAVLTNGAAHLHTAWWYDNGTNRTIGQLQWRWDVLRGANDYAVVNITAASEAELETAIVDIQKNTQFNQLLQ